MTDRRASTILCGTHGRGTPAVVCGHLLGDSDRVRGFVENSSDPTDLQAWCEDCEHMFVEEGEMTLAFRQFTDMQVVCTACYERARARHARELGALTTSTSSP